MPTCAVVPSDVAGLMEELWACQATLHACWAGREPRAHGFDYLAGQGSQLERKSSEPMALQVEEGYHPRHAAVHQ